MHALPHSLSPSQPIPPGLHLCCRLAQAARTYLEKHLDTLPTASMDELVQHGLKALAATLSDGELTKANVSVAIVGPDSSFVILEEDAVEPYVAVSDLGQVPAAYYTCLAWKALECRMPFSECLTGVLARVDGLWSRVSANDVSVAVLNGLLCSGAEWCGQRHTWPWECHTHPQLHDGVPDGRRQCCCVLCSW
jgi:hypothetical protein